MVGAGYSAYLAQKVAAEIRAMGLTADVIDVRVLNPFDPEIILRSVSKTGKLLVVDGGWSNCGFAGEVIASVCERLDPSKLICSPQGLHFQIVLLLVHLN